MVEWIAQVALGMGMCWLLLIAPWQILYWSLNGTICRAIGGHRPRLATEQVGHTEVVGTQLRRISRVNPELIELEVTRFVPAGVPDRHFVRCWVCREELDT